MRKPFGKNTVTVSATLECEVTGGELDLEIACNVPPYRPATGPRYDSGGQPAEGGSVEEWECYELQSGGKRKRRADLDDRFTADELDELVQAQADDGDDPRDDYDPEREYDRAENRERNAALDRGDW